MKTKKNRLFLKKLGVIFILFMALDTIAQSKKNEVVKIKTSAECDQCKKRLESNLIYVKGVKFAKLDVPSKILTVTFNAEKTNVDKIRSEISLLGYDADAVKADSLQYEKLPACCKKGGGHH
jgi:copper chaperone CopZ